MSEQLKRSQEKERDVSRKADTTHSDIKQQLSKSVTDIEDLKRQLEQVEVEKASMQKRVRDKDKRVAGLECSIADLEEEKLTQFRDL